MLPGDLLQALCSPTGLAMLHHLSILQAIQWIPNMRPVTGACTGSGTTYVIMTLKHRKCLQLILKLSF